jgi:chorismate synthase
MPVFTAGVEDNVVVGDTVSAVIYNQNQRSGDYNKLAGIPRPGHADFAAYKKYGADYDLSGGGEFSGRLTAPICIAGGIAKQILEKRNIYVGAHIYSVGNIEDTAFKDIDLDKDLLDNTGKKPLATIGDGVAEKMLSLIEKTKEQLDSVGGVVECAVIGMPAGVGGELFDGLESRISEAIFGIPAVKGVEFGDGFWAARTYGSFNNDQYTVENGEVKPITNHAGGILGGISTAEPLIVRAAIKPTPSISKPQKSVNMKTLEALLHDAENEAHKILVSIQFANNEIGTIQHIKEIAEIAHKYNAVFHTDAVQAFGQIPIDVKELDIDMLSASGHKLGTPKGIGILYKKDSVQIDPLIYGSQMDGMRGGTENVPYIIGIAKAIELLQNDKERQLRLTILRNNFISQLKALGCTVNGSLYERLPNNINVTFFQDINAENLVYLLDMCEIYIGIGSACDSHSVETSHVLRAIGLSDEDAMKTIRITLPDDITMDEIDRAVCNITKQIMLLTMEDKQND